MSHITDLRHAETSARMDMLTAEQKLYAHNPDRDFASLKAEYEAKYQAWIDADKAFFVAVLDLEASNKTLTAQLAAAEATIAQLIGESDE